VILTHLVLFGFLGGAGGTITPEEPPAVVPPQVVSYGGGRQHMLPSGRFKTAPGDAELQEQQDTEEIAFITSVILRTLQ
jgi:hypothetical protein